MEKAILLTEEEIEAVSRALDHYYSDLLFYNKNGKLIGCRLGIGTSYLFKLTGLRHLTQPP